MKWFNTNEIRDLNDLRSAYKKLLIKYHPDNNTEDTTADMQEINAEYASLFQQLKNGFEHSDYYEKATDRQKQNYSWEKDKQIREMILALSRLEGLVIEICGVWIYVRGNTKQHKKELRALGLTWNRQKECWIIHFDDYYRHGQQSMSMNYIREKYGSVFVKSAEKAMIE